MAFILVPLAKHPRIAYTLPLLIPIFAITLYLHWGYSKQLSHWLTIKKQNELVRSELTKYGSLDNLIKSLRERVLKTPSNPKGWYLLGKLYLSAKQFALATDALHRAYSLNPHDIKILEKYGEALFLAHDNHLNKEAKHVLNKLLELSPNNINAINILAIDSYREKDYKKAIQYWKHLTSILPPNSADAKSLHEAITLARKKINSSISRTQ